MRPHSNNLAQCSLYCTVLLIAAALAFSAMMLLWPTLPVQAQSESVDNDTGDAPGQSESTDNGTGDTPAQSESTDNNATGNESQPTGKQLIVFSDTDTLPTDYEQRIAVLGGTVEDQYPEIGVVVASGLSEEAAENLESDEDVAVVEEDVERPWLDPVEEPSVEEASSAEDVAESPAKPNIASFYPRQWHLRAIKANEAWAAGKLGSPNVKVAILDTGIDYTHHDLDGRVDLALSRSFVPSDDALVQANFPGAHPIADLHFHGTHVAATVSSNARVAAGVTSKVTLMGVKVLKADGNAQGSSVLNGIMYAADSEADVMNMSLGGYFSKHLNPGFVSGINRAVNYANRKGKAIVVSAGNDNLDLNRDSDGYKMYCQSTHVVCVSATGPTSRGASVNGPWYNMDSLASYSNYGSPITVAAPGGNGNRPTDSNVWAACSTKSLVLPVCRTGIFVIGIQGTSMAAPHASGLAALLVEDIGNGKPSQVAAGVRKSADDLGKPGKDADYGHGRINVAKGLGL